VNYSKDGTFRSQCYWVNDTKSYCDSP